MIRLSESLRVHHALTGILLHLHVTRLIHVYPSAEICGHLSGKGATGPKITLTKGKIERANRKKRGGKKMKIARLIHRIHKWRTRGKKLVPSHESEALEGKQKLQMKTLSELAECFARIPPKITLYGRLFKCNDVRRLLLLMFSTDLLFAIKRDAYIFKETG